MPALEAIADLRLGRSFRSRIEAVPGGVLAVVQTRDVSDDGVLDSRRIDRIDAGAASVEERLRTGDIVVTTRGPSLRAAVVTKDLGPAIAAAPLLRLRIRSAHVLPEYVAWRLNHPTTQAVLARSAEGSNIKMISRASLASVEVEMPPLERQRMIVDLVTLSHREAVLRRLLTACQQRLLSAVTMRFAEGGSR